LTNADKNRAVVSPSLSEDASFVRNEQSGVVECVLCHNRAYSRVSANIRLWEGVHLKYCTLRQPERVKIGLSNT
jgi:hypothetical protein